MSMPGGKKASVERGEKKKKPISLNKRCGLFWTQWVLGHPRRIVTQYGTAKVVCSPRGSGHDMFVMYSITVRSRSGWRASLSFSGR